MTLFPFYQDIEGKTFLVIGGGKVAKEKIRKISQFTDHILVIAKETDLQDGDCGMEIRRKAFEDKDIELGDICIVATSDRALNRHIADLCREKNIPVNVVDDKELCTFIFPSFVKRGDLTISITTSGKSPAYARKMRQDIEKLVPDHIEDILERMDAFRKIVPRYIYQQAKRSMMYKQILHQLLETDNRISDEEILAMIKQEAYKGS